VVCARQSGNFFAVFIASAYPAIPEAFNSQSFNIGVTFISASL
jgi:hypothetical protein